MFRMLQDERRDELGLERGRIRMMILGWSNMIGEELKDRLWAHALHIYFI